MDQEEMLRRILQLTEENSRKIRSLYRAQIWANIRSVIYWIVIIGIAVGFFYYLQPYIDRLNQAMQLLNVNAFKQLVK